MKYSIAIMALLGSTSAVSLARQNQRTADPKVQTPDASRTVFEEHVKTADKVTSTQASTEGTWLKADGAAVAKAAEATYAAKDKVW